MGFSGPIVFICFFYRCLVKHVTVLLNGDMMGMNGIMGACYMYISYLFRFTVVDGCCHVVWVNYITTSLIQCRGIIWNYPKRDMVILAGQS